jgi:fermentation-respiration switch protein FrsA (DUF1100 family)
MRFAATTVLVLLLAWVALAVLAAVYQRSLIYFPIGPVPSPAAVGLDDAEEVVFATEDGLRLQGWFVPCRQSPPRFTLVVFNGNAGNRAYRAPLAHAFRQRGVAVLLFDYRGYGGSEGQPSEEGLARDARAARAYTEARADVDRARVAYFGESLGAAVALGLAKEHPPAVLVLRSPFTSLADVGRHHYPFLPVSWLLRDRYGSLDRIRHVSCPLLVIAGERDSVVPPAQSRALYDAAREPKQFVSVAGTDHNDADLVAGPAVVEATLTALERWGDRRGDEKKSTP